MTMPAAVTAELHKLHQTAAWVWLMAIAITDGPTLRYVANTEDIPYDGNTYTAFSFGAGEVKWNLEGQLPELDLVLSLLAEEVQEAMRDYDGLTDAVVTFTYVHTGLLDEDYSDDTIAWTVQQASGFGSHAVVTLGTRPELRRRMPRRRYDPYRCDHLRFAGGRCGYTGASITGVSLPSGNPVSVTVGGHAFSTGDSVAISNETDLTPSLDGTWVVTKGDANTFTLDGTDGDDYSGPYNSGAIAGFAYCPRTPAACATRGRYPARFGGQITCRAEGVRYV